MDLGFTNGIRRLSLSLPKNMGNINITVSDLFYKEYNTGLAKLP